MALPSTDAKAESWAEESMIKHIQLSEDEILAKADLPPLENDNLALLQEILSKLSKPFSLPSDISTGMLPFTSVLYEGRHLPVVLHHEEPWSFSTLCMYLTLSIL
jgi:hypothetical protein